MAKVDLELLQNLVKKYPNDQDLGREIRNFLNKIKIEKKIKIDGKQSEGDGKSS